MIDKKEVRRYLGVMGTDGGVSDELIAELYAVVKSNINPQIISGNYDIEYKDGGYYLVGTDLVFRGKLIEKILKDCDSLVLFAITLSLNADKLVREYSAKDMLKAVTLNAVLTTYLESYADENDAKIKADMAAIGKGTTMRISCGYGDFDIAMQNGIINLLRADKFLGITVNSSNMLTPVKSITALIGVGGKIFNK